MKTSEIVNGEAVVIEWEKGELSEMVGYAGDYFLDGIDEDGNEYEAIGVSYPDDNEIYEICDIELKTKL